jgi:hypothetical protein
MFLQSLLTSKPTTMSVRFSNSETLLFLSGRSNGVKACRLRILKYLNIFRIHLFFYFLSISTLLNLDVSAQVVLADQNGDPVFTLPSTKFFVPEISAATLGLNFNPLRFRRVWYYTQDSSNNKLYTMLKSTVVNIKCTVTDHNEKSSLVFGEKLNMSPHFELGISRAIDSLLNPSHVNYSTSSISVYIDLQHFNVYDTVTKSPAHKFKHTSYGARISQNIFFGTSWAIAANLSYQNSILKGDLISYQEKNGNEIYIDNNIVTNGDVDGYLHKIKPTENYRISLATPIFSFNPFRKINLNLVPYYFVNFGKGFIPKNNAGIALTFLGDKFYGFDKDKKPNDKPYAFESAFSIGFNALSTGSDKKTYAFVSGSFSVGGRGKRTAKSPGKEATIGFFN